MPRVRDIYEQGDGIPAAASRSEENSPWPEEHPDPSQERAGRARTPSQEALPPPVEHLCRVWSEVGRAILARRADRNSRHDN